MCILNLLNLGEVTYIPSKNGWSDVVLLQGWSSVTVNQLEALFLNEQFIEDGDECAVCHRLNYTQLMGLGKKFCLPIIYHT